MSTEQVHGSEAAIPDEDGVFTVQAPDGGTERVCLIPVFRMEDIPTPPPPKASKRIKLKFYELRDIFYAEKLNGTTGKLANGVTWRLSKLPPDYQGDGRIYFKDRGLGLEFDDPRVGKCLLAGGHYYAEFDPEYEYKRQLEEHARKMALRNLVPCEAGDPGGFFVRWGTSEDKKKWEQRPGWR